jgi:hypothetical protein
VHRFAGHPLNSFIDLLFLANTSAVVMDERHSGYYLHGRNQMHHSGAWMGLLLLRQFACGRVQLPCAADMRRALHAWQRVCLSWGQTRWRRMSRKLS